MIGQGKTVSLGIESRAGDVIGAAGAKGGGASGDGVVWSALETVDAGQLDAADCLANQEVLAGEGGQLPGYCVDERMPAVDAERAVVVGPVLPPLQTGIVGR